MKDLPPLTQKFILHWGEMGTRWGINRTVAQVHALLFLSEKPLPADEIAKTLGVARSNISTSLRELQNWGIVRVVHVIGDRRDHFESMKDVFAMFRVIARERKRREIEPTLRAFVPSDTELAHARRVVAAMEQAEAQGQGAVTLDGKMIDYANVRMARRIIEMGS